MLDTAVTLLRLPIIEACCSHDRIIRLSERPRWQNPLD